MNTLGWIGVWLIAAALLAVVIEGVLVASWGIRLGRRTQVLAGLLANEQAALRADVERLRQALEETRRLWRPYRRALRWLRHPLTIALWQYYVRRAVR